MTGNAARTVRLFPWYRFCRSLIFWQAVWFLYFQGQVSAAAAILLYAIYDVGTMVLEVPSGWLSDRLGRRPTLILSALAELAGAVLLVIGGSFEVLVAGQLLIGASIAFASGTDSALLYESLTADGRGDEIEHHEVRAWRFSFMALAISAVTGGAMAMPHPAAPFAAGALAACALLVVTMRLSEPPRDPAARPQGSELMRLAEIRRAFRKPALVWIFVLSVVMYGFSHVPFVFGQPYILQALAGLGMDADAPLVSGAITSAMMVLSVTVSLAAPGLRARLGLAGVLLGAFALQVALIGVLAMTDAALVILLLLLRMVPDSLSRPFILARVQPDLADHARATYLSLQSLAGRLAFAASLALAALAASDRAAMSFAEISLVLVWYAGAGLTVWLGLAVAATRIGLEPDRPE